MKVLFRAKCDRDDFGFTAEYMLLTLDNEALSTLRSIVAKTVGFGMSFDDEWKVNSVVYNTDSILPTAKLEWFTPDFEYDDDSNSPDDWVEEPTVVNYLSDRGWFVVGDEATVPEGQVKRVELSFTKVWTRGGDIRFLANLDDCDFQMWAGDMNLDDLVNTLANENETCQKCGSRLDANGLCGDDTCPYNSHKQNEKFTEE